MCLFSCALGLGQVLVRVVSFCDSLMVPLLPVLLQPLGKFVILVKINRDLLKFLQYKMLLF